MILHRTRDVWFSSRHRIVSPVSKRCSLSSARGSRTSASFYSLLGTCRTPASTSSPRMQTGVSWCSIGTGMMVQAEMPLMLFRLYIYNRNKCPTTDVSRIRGRAGLRSIGPATSTTDRKKASSSGFLPWWRLHDASPKGCAREDPLRHRLT